MLCERIKVEGVHYKEFKHTIIEQNSNQKCDDKETDDERRILPGITTFQEYSKVATTICYDECYDMLFQSYQYYIQCIAIRTFFRRYIIYVPISCAGVAKSKGVN